MEILEKQVWEVKDIQKFLGIGRRQAYELVQSGQFHVVRVGAKYKIAISRIVLWEAENSLKILSIKGK